MQDTGHDPDVEITGVSTQEGAVEDATQEGVEDATQKAVEEVVIEDGVVEETGVCVLIDTILVECDAQLFRRV